MQLHICIHTYIQVICIENFQKKRNNFETADIKHTQMQYISSTHYFFQAV